jgi:hypothetical protein
MFILQNTNAERTLPGARSTSNYVKLIVLTDMAPQPKPNPPITKPYRIALQVDNKPLYDLPRQHWHVRVANAKSFTFSSGTEMQAMHIWRTQCGGSELLSIETYEPRR